jgi:hypothetical protein
MMCFLLTGVGYTLPYHAEVPFHPIDALLRLACVYYLSPNILFMFLSIKPGRAKHHVRRQ